MASRRRPWSLGRRTTDGEASSSFVGSGGKSAALRANGLSTDVFVCAIAAHPSSSSSIERDRGCMHVMVVLTSPLCMHVLVFLDYNFTNVKFQTHTIILWVRLLSNVTPREQKLKWKTVPRLEKDASIKTFMAAPVPAAHSRYCKERLSCFPLTHYLSMLNFWNPGRGFMNPFSSFKTIYNFTRENSQGLASQQSCGDLR